LGLGFLFHYVTLPAGVGFAVAVLLTRRRHLRGLWLWLGAASAALPPVAWLLFRSWAYRHAPPGVLLVHIIEPLFGLQRDNIGFYAVAGSALLGLPLLPLYGFGLVGAVNRARERDPWAWAVLAPTFGVLAFFVFFYDWADKRFLLYVFPLVVALLAVAFDALLRFASKGGARAPAAFLLVSFCLLWNVIRYPSYGIRYVALTPRDFFEGRSLEGKTSGKLVVSIRGGHVVRLHDTYRAAFREGLFDYERPRFECGILPADRAALEWIGGRLDTFLPAGAPVGLFRPKDWPADDWTATNKVSILLKRPVTAPAPILPIVLGTEPVPNAETIFWCGRFRVYRRLPVPTP
ncbi:MAG TPA: hypothetical protein VGR00_05840, partial [Thermoanaerobaculia bacterium]|nr:hypothetical protein [Thermoanaerobaculia bacterium]